MSERGFSGLVWMGRRAARRTSPAMTTGVSGPTCLFIVDVQRGFIRDATAHIPALVEAAQRNYTHVVATRFYNPPESLYRRIIGWDKFSKGEPDVDLAFAVREDALVIDKPRYSCINDSMLSTLRAWEVKSVDVCGIDTDICVTKTAVDLFEGGIVPRVLSSLCASHAGPEFHDMALRILRRYIGASQVV